MIILSNQDWYSRIGIGYNQYLTYDYYGAEPPFPLSFYTENGLRYYLSDNIWVNTGYLAAGPFSGFQIGGGIRVGPREEVESELEWSGVEEAAETAEAQPYILLFRSIYWSVFAAGGFYFGDQSFSEGQGVRYRMSYDTGEEYIVERALLEDTEEGQWRMLRHVADEEGVFYYEYLVDEQDRLARILYSAPGVDGVHEYIPDDDSFPWINSLTKYDEQRYQTLSERSETVEVQAGSFETDVIEFSDDDYSIKWWLSSEVPGFLVRLESVDTDEQEFRIELLEITENNSRQF
ncbi:MAG: hypothetical protein ACLFR1_11745 [Spirochaetia bacterium]